MADIVTGNVGEGTKEIIRNLPFARMWFWKGKMNEFTRMLETDLDGITGLVATNVCALSFSLRLVTSPQTEQVKHDH